jgi:two-component system, OmpR family, response regulator
MSMVNYYGLAPKTMNEQDKYQNGNGKKVVETPSVATIIVAHADFSVPGSQDNEDLSLKLEDAESRFFELLTRNRVDVIVLDFSRSSAGGIEAILKIRRRSTVPILVVCGPTEAAVRDYQIAGAADCITAPIDLISLNRALQRIISITKRAEVAATSQPQAITFSGLTFRPYQCELVGPDCLTSRLTTLESRLLLHFVTHPWVLYTRAELAEAIYGQYRPVSDRALDVIVNRLRKKLVSVSGPSAQNLIKTEFRRGFMFIAEVSRGETVRPRAEGLPLVAFSAAAT